MLNKTGPISLNDVRTDLGLSSANNLNSSHVRYRATDGSGSNSSTAISMNALRGSVVSWQQTIYDMMGQMADGANWRAYSSRYPASNSNMQNITVQTVGKEHRLYFTTVNTSMDFSIETRYVGYVPKSTTLNISYSRRTGPNDSRGNNNHQALGFQSGPFAGPSKNYEQVAVASPVSRDITTDAAYPYFALCLRAIVNSSSPNQSKVEKFYKDVSVREK